MGEGKTATVSDPNQTRIVYHGYGITLLSLEI
jgi:hypothetical protein